MENIRMPAVAGMFYPSAPSKLKEEINYFLDLTKNGDEYKSLTGLVAPHAGYMYSGKTAAYAYNAIKKQFRTVIILSPSHREYFPGISIYSGDAYKTPLGIIPINKLIREKLVFDSHTIYAGKEGHRNEHAVEVHLPFLQEILKEFTLVPVVIGDQRKSFLEELAFKLSPLIDDETLIIASSDLSHFFPKDEADKLDACVEKNIADFSYDKLMTDLEESRCEACGGGAIFAMMKTAGLLHRTRSKVLARTNSGDVSGDYREVVGYLSAVIYG